MERPGTETTRDYRNEKSEEGNGTSNFNKDEDARLDGMERMMVEQNRMLSEILELLLVQHECREAHREKTVPSRLKKTSFASVKNDENRRAESEVEPKRKKPSSLRKQVIAKQQQQEKIHGDSLKERKAQFALKTLRVENDEKRVRSSTALAVEAAKRDMSRQTAAKLQEDQRYGIACMVFSNTNETVNLE